MRLNIYFFRDSKEDADRSFCWNDDSVDRTLTALDAVDSTDTVKEDPRVTIPDEQATKFINTCTIPEMFPDGSATVQDHSVLRNFATVAFDSKDEVVDARDSWNQQDNGEESLGFISYKKRLSSHSFKHASSPLHFLTSSHSSKCEDVEELMQDKNVNERSVCSTRS